MVRLEPVTLRPVDLHIPRPQPRADQVRASNLEGFGNTATKLDEAIRDLEEASEWLLQATAAGKVAEVGAGAAAYQRLWGLTLVGAYLAKGGLADAGDGQQPGRIALCRFAAENLISEASSLKDRIVNGADALAAARMLLAS
jgi:acyl-CoA dehydrogenase